MTSPRLISNWSGCEAPSRSTVIFTLVPGSPRMCFTAVSVSMPAVEYFFGAGSFRPFSS